MSRSLAQRHQQRVRAQLSSAAAPAGGEVQGSDYELMLAQLVQHRRALKDIQSIERKIEAKHLFLPLYDDWIDAALEHGRGAQDLVLTTCMVWHIDAGNYGRALAIAEYVMRHHLELPDQYERNLATLLIDEFGVAALTGRMQPAQALQILPRVHELTVEEDAPDQARAKLHKAIGYALIGKVGSADVDLTAFPEPVLREALRQCKRALELFDQVGTKKDIERLERRLRAAAAPA